MSNESVYESGQSHEAERSFTLAQMIPYLRRRYAFTAADKFGAMVAHQDIARMALAMDCVEGMDVLVQSRVDNSAGAMRLPLDELRQDYPGKRIEIHEAADLLNLLEKRRYVFPVDGSSFLKLSSVRRASGDQKFPISVIIHAVPGHHQIDSYISALLFSEPYDALVVSSEQARIALDHALSAAAEFLGKSAGTPKPSIRIVKIPLSVDTDFIQERDRTAARQLIGLEPDDIVLLYLGRLSPGYKGDLEPLLRVFQELHRETPKLRLIIAGRDQEQPYAPELAQLASELGVRDQVTILPDFPFYLKPAFLSAADIFVSPVDNIQESFGLSIIEAMAAGLPVVASDWSGYRDLIVHAETGLLVETYWDAEYAGALSKFGPMSQNGLVELLLSEGTVVSSRSLYQCLHLLAVNVELRRTLGKAGRRRAEQLFSLRVVGNQHEALWREQWDELDRQPRQQRPVIGADFNTVFGHFASHHMPDDMHLVCSKSGRELLLSGTPYSHRIPRGADWRDLSKALGSCDGTPRRFEDLCADSGVTRQGIVWLFKKGLLETGEGGCFQG